MERCTGYKHDDEEGAVVRTGKPDVRTAGSEVDGQGVDIKTVRKTDREERRRERGRETDRQTDRLAVR